MSSKTRVLQKTSSERTDAVASKRKQKAKFTIAVLAFAAVLTLSILNDYLFIGWLSISAAIVLSLFAIHIIGSQQIQRK